MSLLAGEIAKLQETVTADLAQKALNTLREANQRFLDDGIAEDAPQLGDYFPSFILPNAYGQLINSRDLISQGPLIISFFKGSWSPYCELELRAFQHPLPDIKSRHAQLACISPMLPNHCMAIQEEAQLDYEMLSDVGNRLATELDLVYALPPDVIEVYQELGYNIPSYNGDQRWELPIPATYLVETTGKIALAHINFDCRKRLDPTAIIAVLSAIQQMPMEFYTT